jgi:hypothetical protein
MKEIILRIDAAEQMRMKAIVMDRDCTDAMELVTSLLERVEKAQKSGMRSHLDS